MMLMFGAIRWEFVAAGSTIPSRTELLSKVKVNVGSLNGLDIITMRLLSGIHYTCFISRLYVEVGKH
jgi:hypothetical protein